MSGDTKQTWGQHRAVWDLTREQTLLKLFDKARQDAKLRTDRGLKARGWETIAEQINKRCNSSFNVDQLKSKYARLMMDYELFEDVGGERSLSEEAWDKLILNIPENAKRLRQFKESGFPHADICRRIAAGKEELTDKTAKEENPKAHVRIPVVSVKRSSRLGDELPDAKRACINVELQPIRWGFHEEKLLLCLCWKAKKDREEGINPKVWLEVTAELNQHCKANSTEEQVKDEYLLLMQAYDQFKRATGFTGAPETTPKSGEDWNQLIHDHPQFSLELQELKNKGGFPHVEVCSLIAGDKSTDGVDPASLSEFLVTGALQRNGGKIELNAQSVNAVGSAQASLSASALSQLLPATENLMTLPQPSATRGQPDPAEAAAATPGIAPAASAPAVFTQELHDNLNMFLKTSTAYLVMLINDHNVESEE